MNDSYPRCYDEPSGGQPPVDYRAPESAPGYKNICRKAHSPSFETEPLEALLRELRTTVAEERLSTIRQGREARFFGRDPLIPRLIRSLRATSERGAVVEKFLDELFEDLRPKESFEHSEIVMAILFALRSADEALLRSIATVFTESKAAEIGRVAQFARGLLSELP
jgi:hypothetical protein